MSTNDRSTEDDAFRAFAGRHGLSRAGADGPLPIRGRFEGIDLAIAKVERGQSRTPWPATQFLATAPLEVPGGLVAYKPNFRFRLPGHRRISDQVGVSGLLGFVHHDRVGDADLDRKLVIYADDVPLTRALLTNPDVKGSILAALAAAGHIRIVRSQVALEVSERRRGVVALASSAEEIESLARAAVSVARALGTAVAHWNKGAPR